MAHTEYRGRTLTQVDVFKFIALESRVTGILTLEFIAHLTNMYNKYGVLCSVIANTNYECVIMITTYTDGCSEIAHSQTEYGNTEHGIPSRYRYVAIRVRCRLCNHGGYYHH